MHVFKNIVLGLVKSQKAVIGFHDIYFKTSLCKYYTLTVVSREVSKELVSVETQNIRRDFFTVIIFLYLFYCFVFQIF